MPEQKRISPLWWLVVFLGFGLALGLSYELLFQTQGEMLRGLNPHQKDLMEQETLKVLEGLKGKIGGFWVNQGRLPRSFDEMIEYRTIEPAERNDPFRHPIRWEEDASGVTLRSAGWDRVFGTLDDVTLEIFLK